MSEHLAAAEERLVSERIRQKLQEVNSAAQQVLAPVQDHVNFNLQVWVLGDWIGLDWIECECDNDEWLDEWNSKRTSNARTSASIGGGGKRRSAAAWSTAACRWWVPSSVWRMRWATSRRSWTELWWCAKTSLRRPSPSTTTNPTLCLTWSPASTSPSATPSPPSPTSPTLSCLPSPTTTTTTSFHSHFHHHLLNPWMWTFLFTSLIQ